MDTDTEDTIYLTCQSCGSIHTIGDDGELELIEDTREGAKGIGGIRTHTAGPAGSNWQSELYKSREPKQYNPPLSMVAGKAGRQEFVEPDSDLIEAHNKDLRNRNIPIDTND